jgi:hypothetical protein
VEEGSGVAEGGAIVVDDHNVQELRPAGHGARLRPEERGARSRSGEQKKGRVFVLISCYSVVVSSWFGLVGRSGHDTTHRRQIGWTCYASIIPWAAHVGIPVSSTEY